MQGAHEDSSEVESSDHDQLMMNDEAVWDDPKSLRGEIFTEDQLVAHARALGRFHNLVSSKSSALPLRKRFKETRRLVQKAYKTLAQGAERKRDPSPAEVWLLDNSHVVEGQLREIDEDLPWGYLVKLPRMDRGKMRGYPLVYGLCLDYLRHTDCHINLRSLSRFVDAYQTSRVLTIGELWAVPIMLRLGLVLAVGGLASSEVNASDRDLAESWAKCLLSPQASKPGERELAALARQRTLAELRLFGSKKTPSDALLVTLLKRLREREDSSGEALEWISEQTARLGTTPEDLARGYHLRQAADQVSVGNAITSMRSINNLDWSVFFKATSHVESILARDPSDVYTALDDTSRDSCRHAVERIARRSRCSESEVAETALSMAQSADLGGESYKAHVGYYLVDEGRITLQESVGYRSRLGAGLRAFSKANPAAPYLLAIFSITTTLADCAWLPLFRLDPTSWLPFLLVPAILLGTSEIAVAMTNSLVVTFVPPRLLPKFEFKQGIPEEHRTLVVVPTILTGSQGLRQLLEELEVRSLANADEYLHFALLTDFADADQVEKEGESTLVAEAVAAIERLNAGRLEPRYFFFHRRRIENVNEQDTAHRFLGWERKRGKLDELNRLLRGDTNTSFEIVTASQEILSRIRYVITLDTDTELPLGVARRLVGTMAHPLNRPIIDANSQRVVRGHAIIQPRVGTSPMSARKSIFARLAAGPPGIDPYTTAVSDVYQDLFGEGSFVGKGIYDVDAYSKVMKGRVPENQLLSHDLFESIYTRPALASDIEVLDEQPAHYSVATGRQHRWMRGDWQLLPWFRRAMPAQTGTRPFDFRALDVWRVADNLRRSLLPPALVVLGICTWLAGALPALVGTAIIVAVFVVPVLGRLVFAFARSNSQLQWLGGLYGDLKSNSLQSFLSLVFLLDQAIVSIDAIARVLYRQTVSRQKLLEWTSMRDATRAEGGGVLTVPRLLWGAALSFVLGVCVLYWTPDAFFVAAPVLLLWLASPYVASYISQVRPLVEAEPWGAEEARSFRLIARKTWRFFERFVGDADHHLPPDNYQEDPRGIVAHRTSPTNIGLYLLAVAAARDLGFIGLNESIQRWTRTLLTIEKLEKREGHILNWYDTTTLAALEPRYVSTVDSGNLAGYLWTLAITCREAQTTSLLCSHTLEAARDAILLAGEENRKHENSSELKKLCDELDLSLTHAIEGCEKDPSAIYSLLRHTSSETNRALNKIGPTLANYQAGYWLKTAQTTVQEALDSLEAHLPYLRSLEGLRRSLGDVLDENLSKSFAKLAEQMHRESTLRGIFEQAQSLRQAARELTDQWVSELDTQVKLALGQFEIDLDKAQEEAQKTMALLDDLATRAETLVEQMDFSFLYDEERSLFSIGYNVGASRLDSSHYDLLASEARLASLVAIAKGDIPQKHWFRLGRLRAKYASVPGLLSWSGSMFEYLMPLLVMRSFPDTLLDQTYHAVIERQILHGQAFGVPWGVSEAAYNVMDLGMNYQYRAFGVPELGLKPGLGEDLVVAPYATALAALVRTRAAAENFEALRRAGLDGEFGFYESVDFTPARLPPGRKFVVVKAFMAHHQGMTLLALSNLLTDFTMQRRFHSDARIKACALLLEERIPARAGVVQPETPRVAPKLATAMETGISEHLDFEQVRNGNVRGQLLGFGTLSTWVTAAGEGFTTWRGFDLNRFREDSAVGAGGIYLYIRNLSEGTMWSSGYLPTRAEPTHYDVFFSIDKIELQRRDGDIETSTEIVLSPEYPAEVRRVTLTNHGQSTVRLDLTSFTELSLSGHAADVAHPAFQKMFVETELFPSQNALLAHRRKRSDNEPEIWLAQILTTREGAAFPTTFCTCRNSFLGREGSVAMPSMMTSNRELNGITKGSLDPALVLRRVLELPPGEQTQLSLVTLVAESREELLEQIGRFSAPHSIPRAFELAWVDARVELRHLNVTSSHSHRYQRLLSAVLFPNALLRGNVNPPGGTRGRDALWSQGISGDLPIVVLRLDDHDFVDLCREMLLAHEYWRLNGVRSDLVILNEEAPGYLQPVQEAVLGLIRSTSADGHIDQPGGVFLRRATLIADEDLQLLFCSARAVLMASKGSLARQLRPLAGQSGRSKSRRLTDKPLTAPAEHRTKYLKSNNPVSTPRPDFEPLAFDNDIGGFCRDTGDYVMQISAGRRPLQPWSNVIASPHFGALVTESGSSFTWHKNSQKNRLTPWSNDPTLDPSGELFFAQDDETGETWSLTPAPLGGSAIYSVRHGQGYSSFEHSRGELAQKLTVSVGPSDPVKIWHLSIRNIGQQIKRLNLYGIVEWVLGNSRENLRVSTLTSYRPELNAILARNPFGPFPQSRAFFACTEKPSSYTANREEFFGRMGSRERPAVLDHGSLSGAVGAALDPAAAFELRVTLAAGQKHEVAFVLGAGEDERQAVELLTRYIQLNEASSVIKSSADGFNEVLDQLHVTTPDSAFDLMTNYWLLYQVLSCRFWGRSGFYQSGGAYGFRDQLQDSLALLHARPDLTREHLIISAARQFVEGDVQHWWHADTGEGVRTHCSDDLIWLPWAALKYAASTGDQALWNEQIHFLQERVLNPGEEDLYRVPPVSAESASMYEHCARALEAASTSGPHGLPLMRAGDWNDGMNRVGSQGVGESVWLAWFLGSVLEEFAPLAQARGDMERAAWCRSEATRLGRCVDESAWDGGWYRRAYFDDGQALGSQANVECRIDAIAQSWAVLSGLGRSDRASQALDASLAQLVRRDEKMLLLLTPPFEGKGPDPGYIASYPPGIRENGGQYTHGVLWTVLALLQQGRGDEGHELLAMLNPIAHTTHVEDLSKYQVEPYVLAADVYSHEPHLGRGGWTWYTGSASWMYRISIEGVIGLRKLGSALEIAPCVPASWKQFQAEYRTPGWGKLLIHFENPHNVCSGVESMVLDGVIIPGNRIQLPTDGEDHNLLVTLGHVAHNC